MTPFKKFIFFRTFIEGPASSYFIVAKDVPNSIAQTNIFDLKGFCRTGDYCPSFPGGIPRQIAEIKKVISSNIGLPGPQHLALLSVALIVWAFVVISLHNHPSLMNYAACIICKSAHSLSSGESAAAFSLILPAVLFGTDIIAQIIRCMAGIFVTPKSTRGPPRTMAES